MYTVIKKMKYDESYNFAREVWHQIRMIIIILHVARSQNLVSFICESVTPQWLSTVLRSNVFKYFSFGCIQNDELK